MKTQNLSPKILPMKPFCVYKPFVQQNTSIDSFLICDPPLETQSMGSPKNCFAVMNAAKHKRIYTLKRQINLKLQFVMSADCFAVICVNFFNGAASPSIFLSCSAIVRVSFFHELTNKKKTKWRNKMVQSVIDRCQNFDQSSAISDKA